MVTLVYPDRYGYRAFRLESYRPRGVHHHRSIYTGKLHQSYGGARRYRGHFVTPNLGRGADARALGELIRQLTDPRNDLRLRKPVTLEILTVQPIDVQVAQVETESGPRPSRQDSRGIWSPWQVNFLVLAPSDIRL